MELLLAFMGLAFLIMAYTFLRLSFAVVKIAERLSPAPLEAPMGPALDIPLDIQNLIDLESELWAKQDLELEARRLYAIHGDWAIVHVQLLQQVGEPQGTEASDRAWEAEPEVVDQDSEPVAEGF